MSGAGRQRFPWLAALMLAAIVTVGLANGCSDSGEPTTTAEPVAATSTTVLDLFAGKDLVMATDVQIDDARGKEGTSTVVGDITQIRGMVRVTEWKASDERLNGQCVTELNADARTDGSGSMWGIHELTNEGGSWKGTWYGSNDEGMYSKSVLRGAGKYQGLEAHLQMHETDAEDPFPGTERVWTGWVQKAE